MFDAGLRTTAMGILPHIEIDAALDLALSVDIPFWPQLPRVSFYEDMYDWDFLLMADLELLSFDAFARGDLFVRYAAEIGHFLARGGILSWGIVPTGAADLADQSPASLVARLEALWDHLVDEGLDREQIVHQGLLAPATCCLINPDRTETVDRAFDMLGAVSETLRARYGLN